MAASSQEFGQQCNCFIGHHGAPAWAFITIRALSDGTSHFRPTPLVHLQGRQTGIVVAGVGNEGFGSGDHGVCMVLCAIQLTSFPGISGNDLTKLQSAGVVMTKTDSRPSM